MTSRNLRKYRLRKSPFMLTCVAGLLAIVLDFIWALSVVLDHYLGTNLAMPVHFLLLVLFPVCFMLVIKAMRLYCRKGYMREERRCEKEQIKRDTASNRYKKV